jgi:hypothetical protein
LAYVVGSAPDTWPGALSPSVVASAARCL